MRGSRRLAILILAHKDVEQLNRLLGALQHPDIDVYVHIDAKQDETFRSRVGEGMCFLMRRSESVDIAWGDIGMPIATVRLMRHAATRGDYGHMMLISGSDYPVRSIHKLLKRLSDANDCLNVIDSHRFDSRYLLYYPSWLIGKQPLKRPIRGFYKCLGMGPFKGILKRKGGPSARYWCGSSWWVLRGEVVQWVLREIDRNPLWLSYYENALNPDEGLFQTMYMNSPFAGQNEEILTYIDWSAHGSSPEVLAKDDFDRIRASGKYFARKMESGASDALLDMVDEAIAAESEANSRGACD